MNDSLMKTNVSAMKIETVPGVEEELVDDGREEEAGHGEPSEKMEFRLLLFLF